MAPKLNMISLCVLSLFLGVILIIQNKDNQNLSKELKNLRYHYQNSQQALSQSSSITPEKLTQQLENYRVNLIKQLQRNVVYIITSENKGSGFFVNDSGQLLTNCHVVGHDKTARVMTWDHQWYEVNVIGRDPIADIALLQFNQHDLNDLKETHHAKLGVRFANSHEVKCGQSILTMGAPHNQTNTVNRGHVTHPSRYLEGLSVLDQTSGLFNLYIQVNADIMPGHSGAPTFNLKGEVIGVNTRANHQNSSEGYLIPSNYVKERMISLKNSKNHTNVYASLGFELDPYFSSMEGHNKLLPVDQDSAIVVRKISTLSNAFKQGLREGDVILKINGQPINLKHQRDVMPIRKKIALNQTQLSYTLTVVSLLDRSQKEIDVVSENMAMLTSKTNKMPQQWHLVGNQ